MRRLAACMMLAAALVLGSSAAAAAQQQPYPPPTGTLVLSQSSVAPGGSFTATLNGCTDSEAVNFTVAGDSATATCDDGVATATLRAPSEADTYTVTATSPTVSATATLAVVGPDDDDELPQAGSNTTPIVQLGLGVLVAGLGLVGVAWYRRRSSAAA